MTERLTASDLSAQLHTPLKTLEFWRAHGKGPRYARIGRRVLYRRVDVEEWLTCAFDGA
jgi:hypothetical protein